jgi:hypothetical protein
MNNEQTKMMREIATEFVVKTAKSENEKSCGLSVEAAALSLLWQVVDPTPNVKATDLAFKVLECLIGRHEAKTAVALAEGLKFYQTPQDSDF